MLRISYKKDTRGVLKAMGPQKFEAEIGEMLYRAAGRLATEMEKEAKVTYESKRIAAKRNQVIKSFAIRTLKTAKNGAIAVVSSGGSKAPHAVFLEYDRRLRNGNMWSAVNPNAPYAFMKAGMDKGMQLAPKIIKEEISKIKV